MSSIASTDHESSCDSAAHYDTAERMLGVAPVTYDDAGDDLLKEIARELGVEDTHAKVNAGVCFGEPGVTAPDPFFGGQGPARTAVTGAGGA